MSGKKFFKLLVNDEVFKGYVEFAGPKHVMVYIEEPVRIFLSEWKLPDNSPFTYDYLESDEPMIKLGDKMILNLKPNIKNKVTDRLINN